MAEKEYIEREAMNNVLDELMVNDSVYNALQAIPAADVVEVVRCKDCKWYKESKLLAPNKFCFRLKDRNGDPIGYNFAPDEFCSFGERKGNNNDKT
ncbi:MAG: hypothetical protein ACI4SF_00670 [Oscillospiraceae bacterium]